MMKSKSVLFSSLSINGMMHTYDQLFLNLIIYFMSSTARHLKFRYSKHVVIVTYQDVERKINSL